MLTTTVTTAMMTTIMIVLILTTMMAITMLAELVVPKTGLNEDDHRRLDVSSGEGGSRDDGHDDDEHRLSVSESVVKAQHFTLSVMATMILMIVTTMNQTMRIVTLTNRS